jgi:hypothetical protein
MKTKSTACICDIFENKTTGGEIIIDIEFFSFH